MRLVLHIGSLKTGTKAAQHWLRENRVLLARQGIWHPASLGALQNSNLPLMFLPFIPGAAEFVVEGIETAEDCQLFASRSRSDFEREYRRARTEKMRVAVISSELLQLYITDSEQANRLSAYLKQYFDEIEILLTVRPQIDAIVSWSSTAARGGEIIDETWFRNVDRHKDVFSYHRCYRFWSGVFGTDHVHLYKHDHVRPFPSILARLIDLRVDGLTAETRRNNALSVEALRLLNAMHVSKALTVPMSARLTSGTENDFLFRSALSIGLPLAQWIQGHFDAENEELLERFQNLTRSDLFPDWTKYERAANLEALDAPCDFSPELGMLMASVAKLLEEGDRQTRQVCREFRQSTSWRVTAPLRAVRRAKGRKDVLF